MKCALGPPVLALLLLGSAGTAAAQSPLARAQASFADDVHAAAGLTCATCHRDQETPVAPARTAIASQCARCHSDAAYMRQFDPQVRVDQLAQYATSVHGQQMAKGEDRTATCSDCHGAHGVRRVSDARSPVAPLNVATTCAKCHSDTERMAAFKLPATPVEDWSASVHALALLKRSDTSAPTCNTCHGSHGAVPPGVTSVANVCAQCHVREAELFRASPKKDIFDAMGQAECLVCHNNHRIDAPRDGMIGIGEGQVCSMCHDDAVNGITTIRNVRQRLDALSAAIAQAEQTLMRAERAGMLVDEGRLALRDAREAQINARVLVHAFADAPLLKAAAPGLAGAARAEQAGEGALHELQSRHRGLGVATVLLVGFLTALWLKIRSLPVDS